MDLTRRSGVLLHPTALPGRFGRGDLGPAAWAFVDSLAEAAQSVWQVLPLNPPGYGGSPYAGASAFAGDALLVSPELLVREGLLEPSDLAGASWPEGRVSPEAEAWRRGLLGRAWLAFQASASAAQREELANFRREHAGWLEDYALFAATKEAHGGGAYWAAGWSPGLRRHLGPSLRQARRELARQVEEEVFGQFLFERQWRALAEHARAKGISILGDLPIFVARDSADVWAHPELFLLDGEGDPAVVAGVPPDLFSETGQLWGNPLYDWEVHARTGYAWWVERMHRALGWMDLIRIDHFRGFASYWEIPAGDPTAVGGHWVEGPRMRLFQAIREALGELPIVAEDLGEVTPDVPELLAATGFPGMRILQFAWSGEPDHPFLPENHPLNAVAYTGTHDNETTAGWFQNLTPEVRARVVARVGQADPVWGLIELGFGSPAFLMITPVQDLLGLGNEARFNSPGTSGEHNWTWRLRPGQLDPATLDRLGALTRAHGREGE